VAVVGGGQGDRAGTGLAKGVAARVVGHSARARA
jgi:hypothetical protein